MQTDHPLYEGYLGFPNTGKLLKKSSQKKYCLLYKRSNMGLARIEIFDNISKNCQAKIVPLEDVIKITPKAPNAIKIVTKNISIDFETIPALCWGKWLEALQRAAFTEPVTGFEQDNELYCSTDDGIFQVILQSSEASNRCNLPEYAYILKITSVSLQLYIETGDKLLYNWPFSYIRKYGYKNGMFMFEAGRKCATGEGVFYFKGNNNEIYRCVSAKMKAMKQLLNRDISFVTDCADPELRAALSMEAGSRNPLPLSINSKFNSVHSSHDSVLSTDEDFSVRNKYDIVENRTDAWKTMGVHDPVHSEIGAEGSSRNPPKREKKLPEKQAGTFMIAGQTSPIETYDCLQHFGSTNALDSKHGYKTVLHNRSMENLSVKNSNLQRSNLRSSIGSITTHKSSYSMECTEAPIIVDVTPDADQSYDHLNFFGQATGVSQAYKQVQSPTNQPQKPPIYTDSSCNDYEVVQVMEPARSADDTSQGYGKIKKDTKNEFVKSGDAPKIPHHYTNHQAYAIISKPKRV